MAPYQLKASKPKFQPRAGGRILAGRIEKREKHANKQFKMTMHTFNSVLTIRTKKDSSNNAPADQVKQDSFNNALTDRVNEESLVTNPPSAAEATIFLPPQTNTPFKLREAIPKAGLRFPGEQKGKRSILGRWKNEDRVTQALCADMKIADKRHVQGVVSPVFHQAAEMVESGYMWGMVRGEDITQEEGRGLWKRFLGKLWAHSTKRWPRRLSEQQFSHFFSALAEARWAGIHQPRSDGREPGLLAQHISLFLEAAERTGFPWANGGDVFSETDE